VAQIEAAANGAGGGVAWNVRSAGLTMSTTGRNDVKEFTGMWPLKADADLEALQQVLVPNGTWMPSDTNFETATTALGLIRTARWFVAQDPGLRRLDPVLRHAVRRQPAEVLRRLRPERQAEPAGDLGPVRGVPARPRHDGGRRGRLHRTGSDQDPRLLRLRPGAEQQPISR
jgi:hypothetical protein